MIGHNRKAVQAVVSRITKTNGIDHHLSDFRLPQIEWTGGSIVKKPVHRQEGSARDRRWWETTIVREAAVKAPGKEGGFSQPVIVWQAPGVERAHRISGRG